MDFLDHSEETTELGKALLQVQRQMSPAMKDGKNPFTRSNYATLNSVMEACREALLNNNIWLCQYPVPVEQADCLGLMTKLTHTESGQWQASLTVVPLPKADPQGMGSAITYARRYAITAMLGIVTEDDDGEAAKKPQGSKAAYGKPGEMVAHTTENSSPDLQDNPFPELQENEYPMLEGVIFQRLTAQDGRECIIATGNTQPNKAVLAKEGFRWNAQRKYWWKYSAAI